MDNLKVETAADEATIGLSGEGTAVLQGDSTTLQGNDVFGGMDADLGRSRFDNSPEHIGEELPAHWYVMSKKARKL